MKNALTMLAKLHARAVKAYGAYLEATPGTQAKIRKWDAYERAENRFDEALGKIQES